MPASSRRQHHPHARAQARREFLGNQRPTRLGGEMLEPRYMLAVDLLRADPPTDSIVRYDGDTGAPVGAFVSSGSGGLVDPHNPIFGPDGNLYVFSTAPGAQKILKYNGSSGAFMNTFVNTGAGGFAGGFGMTFGPNGDLYVATGGPNVLRYNGATGAFVGIAASGNGITRASGVEFGPDGNLYVLDSDLVTNSGYDRILRFQPTTAALIDVFVEPGSLEDSISFSFGPDGHLYVPDLKLQRTLSFNGTTGDLQESFTARGSSVNSFAFDIVFGPDGNAYAATAERVARFEGETGDFLDTFVEGPGGSIVFFPKPTPASDLAVTNVQIPSGATRGASDLSITYTVKNNGASPTAVNEWTDVVYLSADNVFDATDRELGRVERTSALAGGASYTETLDITVPAVSFGDYHVIVVADRRGVTNDPSRLNNIISSVNTLEIFPAVASSHDPANSLAVGRQLSAYTTADVNNGELTITYSVYNLTDGYVQGALLTTTLAANVAYRSASRLPDRSGQQLAWSLGTIAPFERVSVEVQVALAGPFVTQVDLGPRVFATLDTVAIADSLGAAILRTDSLAPDLLAATPDANSADPFIQGKAAELNQDAGQIYQYLTQQVGFESYVGSQRGALGTLWSQAGNALDVASLGVALLRASGIPAQYAAGALSSGQAQELIQSMFSPNVQTIGAIATGTPVSDPANDPQLLAEAGNHYWYQFDAGAGIQDADPLFASVSLGQSVAIATSTFAEVPDSLREKTTVKLVVETFNQATAAFGFSNGLSQKTVLEQTFNNVDLVGRPLSIGHFVSSNNLSGPAISAKTRVYSPYLLLSDDAFPDPTRNDLIRGTDYQEMLTNFPLGTEIVTGLFLELSLNGPQGAAETYDRTLVDRIGYGGRHGFGPPSLTVDPDETPLIGPTDLYTISIQSGVQSPDTVLPALASLESEQAKFRQLNPATVVAGLPPTLLLATNVNLLYKQARLAQFLAESANFMDYAAAVSNVSAYFDRPRIAIYSSQYDPTSNSTEWAIDLRRGTMRVIPEPGQATQAVVGFNRVRGVADNILETNFLPRTTASRISGTARIFELAEAQSIPVIVITADDFSVLSTLNISGDAKAYITTALQNGLIVVTPSQAVTIGDKTAVSWLEVDPDTGETHGVLENGIHSGIAETGGLKAGAEAPQETILFTEAVEIESGLAPVEGGGGHSILVNAASNGIRSAIEKLAQLTERAIMEKIQSGTDPALPSVLLRLISDTPANRAEREIAVNANQAAGSVDVAIQSPSASLQGDLAASWSSAAITSFVVANLNAASASVVDGAGAPLGSGAVALSGTAVPLQISGNVAYQVNGIGRLAAYGPAESSLGISADWDQFSANVNGTASITLFTDRLMLDGVLLPTGAYTISTSAVSLSGHGPSASPTFAGTLSVSAAQAAVHLEPGSGHVTVGGVALAPANRSLLTNYSGSFTVVSGGAGDADAITLSGNTSHVVSISAAPGTLTTDQNTPVSFQANLKTSFADSYRFTALAPVGWTVNIDNNALVTVTPAPGLQGGTYAIELVASSKANPELVAVGHVLVAINPTAPGLTLEVEPELFFFIPVDGGQLPSAFRAHIRNVGPTTETFNLTIPSLPPGFEMLTTMSSVTVPAGETAVVGLYVKPTSLLPQPGTNASFQVTATSQTNDALNATQTVSFTIPEVHGVRLLAEPQEVSTTPGVPVQVVLVVTARGNVAETVNFSMDLSAGLTVTGLQPVSLNPGESRTLNLTLTPANNTPLNSKLNAAITATFDGREPVKLAIPVHIAAPGVVSISRAATASREVGNNDLANRLTDLSIALTNLTQQPSSDVFRAQALANLDSIVSLLANDPILAKFVGGLTTARNQLRIAVTEGEVLVALNQVGSALDVFAETAVNLARHAPRLLMVTPPQVAQPGAPATFDVLLRNAGSATTTYILSLGALPSGVTGQVTSSSQVTLAPGAFTTVTVAITPPANEVFPFEFSVSATVNGLPNIVQSVVGTLTARREFISVATVIADPPYADPGGLVSVSTRLLNAVNQQQSALVHFQVLNAANAVVFTSDNYPVELGVQTSLTTVSLGTVSTGGFALGQYRVTVTVTDEQSNPLPGATGETVLLVGSPISATLDVSPQNVPPGTSTITNTLEIEVQELPVADLSVLSQTELPGAAGVVKYGHYVYASGTTGIRVFDITDPANPQLIRTFGSSATTLEIRDGKLFALSFGGPFGRFPLTIYSLTNPEDPQFLGNAKFDNADGIPYSLAWNMVVTDTHVFVSLWSTTFLIGGQNDIKFQTGDVLAIDVSDPTAPVFVSALRNTYGTNNDGIGQFINVDNSGGNGNLWEIVQVDANTLLVAGSTAQGDFTQVGSGVVHVIDISDPLHMAIVQTIAIPGTVQAVGLSIEGNLALVAASQGGWNDPAPSNNGDFTGNLVLATLDISDPRNPALIHSEVLDRSSVGPYSLRTTPLGNELFAFSSQGNSQEEPVIFVVDANNPQNLNTSRTTVPAITSNLDGTGNFVYTTSPSGLIIFQLDEPDAVPVVARVQVPTNTGVLVVANSFNVPPTQIIPGASFDTLVWDLTLSSAARSQTLTWQTLVTGMQPGETRDVTLDTFVDFTVQATSGSVTLGSQQVFAEQILALEPAAQTVRPGEAAEYVVRIDNPTALPVTYDLAVLGLPADWVQIEPEIFVDSNSFALMTLTLTSDDFATLANYGFTVTASVGGVRGAVQGTLTLDGVPNLPIASPESHGVVVAVNPQQVTAGQGTAGQYVVRVTNPGSVTESYVLFVSGLDPNFTSQFAQVLVQVPPGASNFVDVPLQITPPVGTAAGDYAFSVTAAGFVDASITDVATASLRVLSLGVSVNIVPAVVTPGSVFPVVVTNVGLTADTFDLALAAGGSLAASLSVGSVFLQPGQSQTVNITLGDIDFALPGNLPLFAVATSRLNSAVRSTDETAVRIDERVGLSVSFTDHEAVLTGPGGTSFVLQIENLGNLPDRYAVEIVATTGAVLAALQFGNQSPASVIPEVVLSSLSNGVMFLNVDLPAPDVGSVTVRVRSLTNDALIAEDTVVIRTAAAPTFDWGDAPNSYGTLLESEGPRHQATGPQLGSLRDGETEGQPSSTALGDDSNEVDDEDGVMLPGFLVAGTCDCAGTGLGNSITVNASAAGYLDAWIDFNRNGRFDANEQVATSLRVFAGANVLTVNVPTTASSGTSFARFRISSVGGLAPTGSANDGEVEDHTVQIFNPIAGSSGVVVDPNNAVGRVLYIKGTVWSDAIVVRQTSASMVTVYVAPFGSTSSFPLNSFDRIVICGGTGSDSIAIEAPIAKPSVIYGDEDNDSISGGSGPDIIFGGPGYDAIAGNIGDDTISGGDSSDSLVGGPGLDRFLGNGSGAVTLSDTQFRSGNNVQFLGYFEAASLTGGSVSDSFNLSGWSYPAAVDGRGGSNTIVDGGDGNFTLAETALTRVLGGVARTIALANFQNATLTGGFGNNSFNLNAWPYPASVSGGLGTDSFSVAGDAAYILTDVMLMRPNQGLIRLDAVEHAILTGGAEDNSFDVSNWTKTGTLIGNEGSDKVVASGNMNFTLSNTSLSRSSGGAFSLASIEHAELTGGGGNNTLSAAGFAGSVKLDGGGGNDTLHSGPGIAMLLGGAGNDILNAGSGRAVLIGGVGIDRLTGGGDGDLLISGQTAFDANAAALGAILAEWASANSYADRVAHLTGTPGGLNNGNNLTGSNVTHDADVDLLFGGLGDDLFFAKLTNPALDIIGDLGVAESIR